MEQARSPFPGMDPYLEARWSDVHVKLIGFMGEAIDASRNQYLTDWSNNRVVKFDSTGHQLWVAGAGNGGHPAGAPAVLAGPVFDVAHDADNLAPAARQRVIGFDENRFS